MQHVSSAQFQAAKENRVPPAEAIAEDLWSVAMPIPAGYLGYTLAVVSAPLGGPAIVIDPGWGSDEALSLLSQFFASIGRRLDDVETIVITHAHPDHSGLVASMMKATGASLAMNRREQAALDAERASPLYSAPELREWGLPSTRIDSLVAEVQAATGGDLPQLQADRLLDDGDVMSTGGRELTVIETPGHTAGHICLADTTAGILLSGDHILPNVFPGIGIGVFTGSNAIDDYLGSLRRTSAFDDFEVVPGHGFRFRGLAERSSMAAEKVLHRGGEVAAVVARDPGASIVEIASQLSWRAGWQTLFDSVLLSTALHQTGIYRDFVRSGGLERHPPGRDQDF